MGNFYLANILLSVSCQVSAKFVHLDCRGSKFDT